MTVYRATTPKYSDLSSLHNPSGNYGRWNETGQNVLYTANCIDNALSEFAYYKLIKKLRSLKNEYKALRKIPPQANSICNGESGVMVSFDVKNRRTIDLLSDPQIQAFCNSCGIPTLSLSQYQSESFYQSTDRKNIIKAYLGSKENVVMVLSARANYCYNVLLLTDKFTIGDFTNLNKQEFTIYPAFKNKICTALQKGFSTNDFIIDISGNQRVLTVI